jgi:hypothetical protein
MYITFNFNKLVIIFKVFNRKAVCLFLNELLMLSDFVASVNVIKL